MEFRLSLKLYYRMTNNTIQSWIIFEKIKANMTNRICQHAPKHSED